MSFFVFMLSSLATFRLALLFSKEAGPGRIFAKLRRLPPPKSSAREGLSCEWCLSVSFAAIITAALTWHGDVSIFYTPIYWLAVSAVAVVINQQWTKS
jgi:hypothetical protein